LGLIFFIVGITFILIDFKHRVLFNFSKIFIILFLLKIILLRRGIKTFDIKQIGGIIPSTSFVGLTISNAVIAFLAVQYILGICCFPLFWPLFWLFVKQYIYVILGLLITSLVKMIMIKITSVFICSPSFVKHRRFIKIIFEI